MKLKSQKLTIPLTILITLSLLSFSFNDKEVENISSQRISFKIKGTGNKDIFVKIGIGSQPGTGACCTGVSPSTTVGFTGNIGDVIYDSKTRRVISKIYKELSGKTINLAEYY